MNVDYMEIAATALEQITLLKAQNAQLEALNTRHVQQLEQLCTERDAARELFNEAMRERDEVQELLESRNAVRE